MDNELAARLGIAPRNYLAPSNMAYYPPLSQVAPVIPKNDKGFMGKMAERLFGADPARVPFDQSYPSAQDAYYAQAYDQTYGTPMAGFTVPGAKVAQIPLSEAEGMSSSEVLQNARLQDLSPENRDAFLRNYIAAQKHPVSAIGYDPHNITYTPSQKGANVNLEGFYKPSKDSLWYYGKNQDSAVHEAFHRGVQKLKEVGLLPESFSKYGIDEETVARMLMLKNFGNIEETGDGEVGDRQIKRAKNKIDLPEARIILRDLEKAAQDYIAKQNPKGPR